MAKKPADQSSNNGAGSAGDAVDLEAALGTDGTDGASEDEDDEGDEGDEGEQGGGSTDIASVVAAAVTAQMGAINRQFQAEMDRRINSALSKGGRKPAKKDDDEEGEQVTGQAGTASDVRGARLAFREYLPESIRFLSSEERALANEFGQNMIRARAHAGFEDEDEAGREVAVATAEFLKKSRSLYSSMTKRALEKQGALIAQGGGQAPGGKIPPNGVAASFEAAEKKDRELFPERYAQK